MTLLRNATLIPDSLYVHCFCFPSPEAFQTFFLFLSFSNFSVCFGAGLFFYIWCWVFYRPFHSRNSWPLIQGNFIFSLMIFSPSLSLFFLYGILKILDFLDWSYNFFSIFLLFIFSHVRFSQLYHPASSWFTGFFPSRFFFIKSFTKLYTFSSLKILVMNKSNKITIKYVPHITKKLRYKEGNLYKQRKKTSAQNIPRHMCRDEAAANQLTVPPSA